MYRIGICDDEKVLLEELCRMCGQILSQLGIEYEMETFGSVKELKEALDLGERFHLLCLDILMPGENGMEFAYELRKRDEETSILFVTNSTDFLLEGYGVRPIQYLLKPVKYSDLERALADDIRLHYAAQTVSVTAGGKTTVLPLASIRYVESRNHGCAFVMEDREPFFWLSMGRAEAMLPKEQFCRCHNSYLINLSQVVGTDSQEVRLKGDIRIPISRRYSKEFQTALTRFLNSK